jgi:hypothetical protein
MLLLSTHLQPFKCEAFLLFIRITELLSFAARPHLRFLSLAFLQGPGTKSGLRIRPTDHSSVNYKSFIGFLCLIHSIF